MANITFIDKKKNPSSLITDTPITTQAFLSNKFYYQKKMHLKGLWLKCDCTTEGAISFVRDNGNTYSLVNKGQEGEHHFTCDLFTLVNQDSNTPTPPTKGKKINKFNPVPIAEGVTGEGGVVNAGNRNAGERQHRIHGLLCNLLAGHKADGKASVTLNQFKNNKKFNLKSALYSQAGQAVVSEKLKVKSLLFIPPKDEYSATKEKIASMVNSFDNKTAPQLFTLFTVNNCHLNDGNTALEFSGNITPVNFNRVTHSYPRTTGPRICFMVQAIIDGSWTDHILYTHPIVSRKTPIMVDSHLERKFFESLSAVLPDTCTITKPYFCDEFYQRKLKPDFIITNFLSSKERKSVVVEVMGMADDEDYVANKKELVLLMSKRYKTEVVEVLPTTIEQSINEIKALIT